MHKIARFAHPLYVAALALGVSLSLQAVAADKPFVKVNGSAISQSFADAFVAEQRAKGAPDSPELRSAVREELVRRELLLQEAKKAGLDKKPAIAAEAEAARQGVLIRSYVQQYVQANPIKEEQLRADYEKIKAQIGGTEYKAAHILVKEEAEAVAIIDKLKKGEKFEELAKQSQDPGSKDNGGDLGWAAPSNYVKPFADAMTALAKGKYTETPVKSDFGYHVILLEDSRPTTFPSFDEVKPRLEQQAQNQQINAMVEALRAKAKVE